MQNNNLSARIVFENALGVLQQLGYNTSHAKATQSFIRSEMAISASVTNYHIPVLSNDNQNGQPFNTEVRLTLQDMFVTSEIGIFLAAPTSLADSAFKLLSYPDEKVITTTLAAAAGYQVYNGSLNLTVNNDVQIQNWDVQRCLNIPQTQQGAATPPVSQYTQGDGFYPVEPNLVMNGAANIQFQLQLVNAVTTVQPFSRIVVIQRGIKLSNVTTVK